MKKAKKGVTRDYNDCTQPEISKHGICTCLVKKNQFGKISAQRLVITADKVDLVIWSLCFYFLRLRKHSTQTCHLFWLQGGVSKTMFWTVNLPSEF